MQFPDDTDATGASIRAALDLDEDERAYLATLQLATTWRTRSATASESARWGWIALFGVISAFITWSVAAQPFNELLADASLVGIGTLLLTSAVELLLGVGQVLIALSTSPVLGLSQPLLALLALALMFWARVRQPVPNYV
jgi:hypothetical protein